MTEHNPMRQQSHDTSLIVLGLALSAISGAVLGFVVGVMVMAL